MFSQAMYSGASAYSQSTKVGLRPEPFGALAYHFDTRRLVFLKSPILVDLVNNIGDYSSADDAIDAVIAPQTEASRTNYHKALESLLDAGVIEAQDVH